MALAPFYCMSVLVNVLWLFGQQHVTNAYIKTEDEMSFTWHVITQQQKQRRGLTSNKHMVCTSDRDVCLWHKFCWTARKDITNVKVHPVSEKKGQKVFFLFVSESLTEKCHISRTLKGVFPSWILIAGSCRTNEKHQYWLDEAEECKPSGSPSPTA